MADYANSTEPSETSNPPVRIVKLTGSRLYVGNLSYATTNDSLRVHMENSGSVIRAEVLYRYDGKSKGCAIVEYATHEEAVEAVKNLNDTELDGRPIFIREDREEGGSSSNSSAPPKRGGHSYSRPARPAPSYGRSGSVRIYVGNVPAGTRWGELKDLFRAHAEVTHADVIYNQNMGTSYGLVSLSTPEEAEKAIAALNGSIFKDSELIVRHERR